jgi:AGZA family xanthine/uracil permease-like MFS transporter
MSRTVTPGSGLDSYFKSSERGTTAGTEVRAGVATVLATAYTIFLNPSVLGAVTVVGLEPVRARPRIQPGRRREPFGSHLSMNRVHAHDVADSGRPKRGRT